VKRHLRRRKEEKVADRRPVPLAELSVTHAQGDDPPIGTP
jgi:hypothetical protein